MTEPIMPRTSVIVVNYNGRAVLIDCLRSLTAQRYQDFEVILVDNGSRDDSLSELRRFLADSRPFFAVRVVPLKENRGFAGGCLEGLRHARGEYIALFNNDTEVAGDCLSELVQVMYAHPEVGICASKIIIHGTHGIDSAGDGFAATLKGFKRGEEEDDRNYSAEEYVFGACAGAALYRLKMLDQIGFFDEDFFLIHEDTDLNCRAQLAGWKVRYVPTAITYHKVRSTIGHMSDIAVYYTLRNSEFVRIKNVPLSLLLICLPEMIVATVCEFNYFVCKHRKLRLFFRAKADAMKKAGTMLAKRREIMSTVKRVDNRYLYSMITPIWNSRFIGMKIKKFFYG